MATPDDNSFGPQYGSRFDFTILFENAMFTILPTSILIASFPFHLFNYRRLPTVARRSPLLWFKVVSAVLLIALEIAKSILWDAVPKYQTDSATAANSLLCIAALCIAIMLFFEHRRFTQSSIQLSVYLSIMVVADGVKSRSYLMRPGLHIVGIVSAATAIVKLILLILQEVPRHLNAVPGGQRRYNQEATGGFWNRTLAIWINSTLFVGFRQALSLDDLAPLGPDFASKHLSTKFEEIWARTPKNSPYALVRAYTLALLGPFCFPIIPRLCLTACTFSSPLIMRRILDSISPENATNSPRQDLAPHVKAGLVISFMLVYLGIAITKSSHLHLTNRHATLLRGLLVSQVLQKTLRLRQAAAEASAALTLMSTDVEGILTNVGQFHGCWIAFLEFGLALFFLYREISNAFFLPTITIAISVIASSFLTKRMRPASEAWTAAIQNRVSRTAIVLSDMKAIKMIGLEPVMIKYLQALRTREIQCSIEARKIDIVKVSLLPIVFAVTPLVTIGASLFWTTLTSGLDAVKVFVIMAYLFLIYQPLFFLLNWLPTWGIVQASSLRIQTFLLLEEHQDSREFTNFRQRQYVEDTEKHALAANVSDEYEDVKRKPRCIVFANVTVLSKTGDRPVLQSLNLSICRESLVMVIGPVASGKSVFLKTIIGETLLLEGEILIDVERFAFCDQNAWLPNISIQATILGESPLDLPWYLEVLHVCALEDDIERLIDGDQTLVGTNGSALSGGQIQRVITARAIYSKATVLVADDILSALDGPTAATVFARVFGPNGLLKRQQRTAILATHSAEYLDASDQVLVVDKAGRITSETADSATKCFSPPATPPTQPPITIQEVPTELGKIVKEVERLKLEIALNRAHTGDLKLYPFFLQSVPKRRLLLFLISLTIVAVLERAPQIYMRVWIDLAPRNKYFLIGLGVIAALSICLNRATAKIYMIGIIPIIAESMHEMFLHSVMGATLPYLTSTGVGPLLNRSSQDMTLMGQDLPMAFYRLVYIFALVLTDTGVIVAGAQYASIMIPVILGILYLIQIFYLRTSRQMRHLDLESKTPLYSQVHDTITGLEHIRSFGWQNRVVDRSLSLLDDSQKPFFYLLSLQRWLGLVLDCCATAVGGIIVLIAVNWPNTTTQSSLGLSLLGIFAYSVALMALVERWTHLETSLGAVARLRSFVQDTPVEEDGPGVEDPGKDWPTSGKIQMHNVTSQYRLNGQTQMALENVSTLIKPRQKVVLMGRTGSGKSSLLLTLLNFLDHTGSIVIDGIDISTVPRKHLRKMITTIPQEPPQISGTVRDNLLPLDIMEEDRRPASYANAIERILTVVGLWEYVQAHGGIDQPVEAMGFSAGQKQLLSLARGIMHHLQFRSKIVLLDEATSNMDYETESLMQLVISRAFAKCTKIVVAHSKASYADCDVILELYQGSVSNEVDVGRWTTAVDESSMYENAESSLRNRRVNLRDEDE